MYNQKILDVFRNIQNVGIVQSANAVGQYINPETADNFKLYLKLEDKKVVSSSFKAFTGIVGVALMSTLTEMVVGLNIEDLPNFDTKTLEEKVGKLDAEDKYLLDDLSKTLSATLEDYQKRLEKDQKNEKKSKK